MKESKYEINVSFECCDQFIKQRCFADAVPSMFSAWLINIRGIFWTTKRKFMDICLQLVLIRPGKT